MGFRTKKSIFYHIPKTGGIWVKEAMRRSGLYYDRTKKTYRRVHKFNLKREHTIPSDVKDFDKEGLFSFAFVRKPFDWYRSFWAHRNRKDYEMVPKFPLDFIWVDNFEKFIGNVLDKYPEGFLHNVYKCYVGEDGDDLDFVGRQENLREDLILALRTAGEQFDEQAIRALRRVNIAASKAELRGMFGIKEKIKKELLKREKWINDTFYK